MRLNKIKTEHFGFFFSYLGIDKMESTIAAINHNIIIILID